MTIYLLWASMLLQLAAATIALTMIPLTRRYTAWILIAVALLFMVSRRILGILFEEREYLNPLLMEGIGLVISGLMALGVLNIRHLFREVHESRERERHQVEIIEQISDIVATVNTRYELVFLNRAGREFFDVPKNVDMRQWTLDKFHNSESRQKLLNEAFPEALRNGCWLGENTIMSANGKEMEVSQAVVAHPPLQGRVPFYSTVIRDLTARKALEHELQEIARTREQLLAILAHDLRGPMGSGLILMDEILRDLPHANPAEMAEELRMVRNALENNYQLMENLLAWTRSHFDQQSIDPVRIVLSSVVAGVVKVFAPGAGHKQVTIRTAIDPALAVQTDPGVFEAVLRNLLSNAIKFSPVGSEVSIRAEREDGIARLMIEDSGPGMDQAQIDRIHHGKPVSSSTGSMGEIGVGLGLSLCTHFIKMHQDVNPLYALHVENLRGTGTRISLVLPIDGD